MPFQPGNQEAKKGSRTKLYARALQMELAAAGDDLKELRLIARVHIDAAKNGDLPAIKELADRIDGKPAQSHEGPDGGPIGLLIGWMPTQLIPSQSTTLPGSNLSPSTTVANDGPASLPIDVPAKP